MNDDTRGPENVVRNLASRVLDLEDTLAAERAHADDLAEVLTRLQPMQQSRERRLIAVALVEHIERREAES